MDTSSRRSRVRRQLRLECLEDRKLLSATRPSPYVVGPQHPTLPPASVIQGNLNLIRASQGMYGGTLPGYLSYSGSGHARPTRSLGTILVGVQQQETPSATTNATDITNGQGILQTSYGEQVNVQYTGQIQTPRPGRRVVSLQGTIQSGTGRFIGATGTFTATGGLQSRDRYRLNFALMPQYATT